MSVPIYIHCGARPGFARGLALVVLAIALGTHTHLARAGAGAGSYVDLQGIRVATDSDRTRLVLDAGRIGSHEVVYHREATRVILRMGLVNRSQASAKLRPWLAELDRQDWVRSVRSRWNEHTGVFTLVIGVSDLGRVRSFVLPPNEQAPHQRLVVDFVHPSARGRGVDFPAQERAATPPQTSSSQPIRGGQRQLDSLVGRLMQSGQFQPTPSDGGVMGGGLSAPYARARKLTIVIDAGHGGKDPGALGSKTHHEKHHTLRYARRLAQEINKHPGMRAILTRKDDNFISLRQRVKIATTAKADLFISLHADSFPNEKARGSSVYALSLAGATSRTAQLMADDANSTLGFGGVQIADHDPMVAATLVDLAQSASIKKSLDFGSVLLAKIGRFQSLHSNKVQQANFFVLRTAEYPAVLVELAFISNRHEEKKLASASFRRNIIRSVIDSIEQFFRINPPAGSYFALQR